MLSDTMATREVGCSVPLLNVVITRVCRKSWISSVFRKNNVLVVYTKKMNDLTVIGGL